jgi:hypothetical protein
VICSLDSRSTLQWGIPVDLGIRKALRARQQDARGTSRKSAEVPLATPTMQAVQESWKGLGTRHANGVWVFEAVTRTLAQWNDSDARVRVTNFVQ